MIPEYSATDKNGFCYWFSQWEKELIAKQLKPVLKKLDRRIAAIKNNPKNEGQVRYQVKIDELLAMQKEVEYIIECFEAK